MIQISRTRRSEQRSIFVPVANGVELPWANLECEICCETAVARERDGDDNGVENEFRGASAHPVKSLMLKELNAGRGNGEGRYCRKWL